MVEVVVTVAQFVEHMLSTLSMLRSMCYFVLLIHIIIVIISFFGNVIVGTLGCVCLYA